jgi:hypothetical protein
MYPDNQEILVSYLTPRKAMNEDALSVEELEKLEANLNNM